MAGYRGPAGFRPAMPPPGRGRCHPVRTVGSLAGGKTGGLFPAG